MNGVLWVPQQPLSEQEQYAQLKKEAEAAAADEVGQIEERMIEQQQQIIKEMEEKRQVYDKWMCQIKQRREAEERRRALKATQAQRLQQERERQSSGIQRLMNQFEEDRLKLEKAVTEEAERQHRAARLRVLLRNAEKSERLEQKRQLEKQRFLVQQQEIRRREVELVSSLSGIDLTHGWYRRRDCVTSINLPLSTLPGGTSFLEHSFSESCEGRPAKPEEPDRRTE